MNETITLSNSPFADIDYRFSDYLSRKKLERSKKMDGNGLPNYAYYMDYECRKKVDSIPGLFKLAKTVTATVVPQMLREYNLQGVLASPTQFSEIYNMAKDCSKILGIGIPNVMIVPAIDGDDFNACTYAIDDEEPIILITGLMAQRMTPGELKAIIGHECGHIHNYHGTYQVLVDLIANIGVVGLLALPGIRQLAGLLTQGAQYALLAFSRACEVTADRAAVICSDNVEDAFNASKKLMYNGAYLQDKVDVNLDVDTLKEQLEMVNSNPVRFYELMTTHPLPLKRIFAQMEFANCETFYEWRPDLLKPGQTLNSKEQTDATVKNYIEVVKGKVGKA